jgi:hypothetical protein
VTWTVNVVKDCGTWAAYETEPYGPYPALCLDLCLDQMQPLSLVPQALSAVSLLPSLPPASARQIITALNKHSLMLLPETKNWQSF